ncbi:uncharacterized protein LOC141735041 [Larus michahellis]|uniref:uncharacterized protein LOC141735041 n=1 Tax=Larus michahellis TaxID=119627 RepID=UPI003D9BEB25
MVEKGYLEGLQPVENWSNLFTIAGSPRRGSTSLLYFQLLYLPQPVSGTGGQRMGRHGNSFSFLKCIIYFQEEQKQSELTPMEWSKRKLVLVLFFTLTCVLIGKWLRGEVPLTISIEPSVVLVEDQVTLSCQVTDNVPSNTSVLWYKMEKGRDAPLCSSSSLGGVVEQCKDEDEWRIVGHWKGRALLLVIQQVQVADEGTYVCALNGSAVMQEATTRLGVTAIGYKPTVDRDVQEENMCRYTCKSKKWYPKPEVIWMNYGGDAVNVEAETNVTWSERDRFTVQSIITVSCDNLDVVCVVKLVKSKISRSGAMNEIIVPHSSSCTYKGRISGSYVKPKVMWINPQGEDVSLLAQTSILQETDNIFTIESSIELPCGQPPPSFVTTEGERRPQIAQQSENGNFIWIICLLVLIILPAVLERQIEKLLSQDRTTRHAEKGNPKEIAVLERQIEKLLSQDRTTRHAEKGNPKEIAVLERQIEKLLSQDRTTRHAEKGNPKEIAVLERQIENLKKEIVDQRKEIEFRKARGNAGKIMSFLMSILNGLKSVNTTEAVLSMERTVADDIKVDGNTAHPNLSIDADEKSFTYKSQAQKVTQTERSFDSSVCVLGSKGFSSGKHYWEVDVEKSNDWDLGVAGKSAPKKGTISLSPKEQFWALGLSFKNYWARTDPWTPLTVQKKPRKIGVYLDCEERMLTFFNVTDMSVMFTFKDCAFSEELYPFFKNSHKESTMRICSVREE